MIKKTKRQVVLILIIMMGVMICSGCSSSKKPGSRLKEVTPMEVKVEGVKFKVGESKVDSITNNGLLVSADSTLKQDVKDLTLPKRTYYLAYVNKDGQKLGTIHLVNNTQQSKPYKDCIISQYTMEFKNDVPGTIQNKYDNILIDGINFNGMTINKVKEVMSKKTTKVSDIKEPDGSIAVLDYTINKVYVSISFDYKTKLVSKVDIQVFNSYFE